MPLNATDLAALSRLLDQAMELDGTERNAWIAGLPEEDQHLAPMLREMLAERDSARTSGFLSSMPELADVGTTDEETAATGDLVGPYRLIRQIGRGGMGTVWLVERADGSFKRLVALKLPRLAWGAGLAERMAREREIGALLEHPNIARLYDAGVDDRGRPFLALEYIDGVQIDVWCKDKDLSVRDRLTLIVQVARAVSYAHGRLVVHRDLKPSNVLISLDGQTHLLDFGIAKLINEASPDERGLTQEQGRVLTPHFASPEQLRGEAITVQSDVYSLGVLTYELLTGRTPYKPTRGTLAALEEAVLEGEPVLASSRAADKGVAKALRGEVDTILAKALRREPGQRYATADAFADDIERHLTGERVLAQPDSFSYRLSKTLRRHRFVFAASFAVVLVVVLGSALSIVQAQRVSRAAERQRLVTNFVADVFRINYRTDSTASQVADLTGDRLLQEGAKLIAQRFPGDPALQADLYGVVGRMFLDMGAADQAVDYGTRQVEALDLASSDNYVRAAALTNLAQALADRGRHADAELRAQHAVELAAGNLPLQANAMAVLAQSFTFRGKNDEALATIEQLEPLTQKIGKETAAEAWMYGLRGNLMSRMNQHADSGPLFDRGIAIALRVDGELSSVASDLRYLRASLMCQNGEAKLARQISDASVRALRARGGPSAILAADRAGYFAREYFSCDVMSYAEAIETITRGQAFLQTQPSAPDSIRRQLDFYRGAIELERGNLGEAERWILPGVESLRHSNDSPFYQFRLVAQLAELNMELGNHDAADRLLVERAQLRADMGALNHPYRVYDYVAQAMNRSMAGEFSLALRILQDAPQLPALASAGDLSDRLKTAIDVARARVLTDSGDREAAWKLVQDVDPAAPVWDGMRSRYATFAELVCSRGKALEGKKVFEALLESAAKYNDPSSPELGWLRAHTGLCAFESRDVFSARLAANAAREIFRAQPRVSSYYKLPLAKLDSLLAVNAGGVAPAPKN